MENQDSGEPQHSDMAGGPDFLNVVGDEAIRACVTIFVGRIEYDRGLDLMTDIWEFVKY